MLGQLKKVWINVAPVSLCNRDIEDKAGRRKEASVAQHECLKWLDSKKSLHHNIIASILINAPQRVNNNFFF